MKPTSCLMKLAASFDGVCYAPLTQIGQGIAATDLPACMESEAKEEERKEETTRQRNACYFALPIQLVMVVAISNSLMPHSMSDHKAACLCSLWE